MTLSFRLSAVVIIGDSPVGTFLGPVPHRLISDPYEYEYECEYEYENNKNSTDPNLPTIHFTVRDNAFGMFA